MASRRPRHNFQTIAWFRDLHRRGMLDLDPPYQRRSVWNQAFKDYFIDSVLLGYPTAALFLYEEFSLGGEVVYRVVDGKQRLTTIFEFLDGTFPVGDKAKQTSVQGKYWNQLEDSVKKSFWGYEFLVEYLPDTDETVINDIFDRINRNVAKLSPQELRHAKHDGEFITSAETLAQWMLEKLPEGFPNLAERSRKQMKDVEVVAHLLLYLESGVKSYSQADLDQAFSDRDTDWSYRSTVEERFRETINRLASIVKDAEPALSRTRLRNQADFFSLFAALSQAPAREVPIEDAAERLSAFVRRVEDPTIRETDSTAAAYYEAARSASNDVGPRNRRIDIIANIICEENSAASHV